MGIQNRGVALLLKGQSLAHQQRLMSQERFLVEYEAPVITCNVIVKDMTLIMLSAATSAAAAHSADTDPQEANDTLVRVIVDRVGNLHGARVCVLCCDSALPKMKYVVQEKRTEQRLSWGNNPFTKLVNEVQNRDLLLAQCMRKIFAKNNARSTFLVLQQGAPIPELSDSSMVCENGWYASGGISSPEVLPYLEGVRKICNLNTMALEADGLMYQVLLQFVDDHVNGPYLLETKDTDSVAIMACALARYPQLRYQDIFLHLEAANRSQQEQSVLPLHQYYGSFFDVYETDKCVVSSTTPLRRFCTEEPVAVGVLRCLDFYSHPLQLMNNVDSPSYRMFEECMQTWNIYRNVSVTASRELLSVCFSKGYVASVFLVFTRGMSKLTMAQLKNLHTISTDAVWMLVVKAPLNKHMRALVFAYRCGLLSRGTHERYIETGHRQQPVWKVNPKCQDREELLTCAFGLSLYGTDYAPTLPRVGAKQITCMLLRRDMFPILSQVMTQCVKGILFTLDKNNPGYVTKEDLTFLRNVCEDTQVTHQHWSEEAYAKLETVVSVGFNSRPASQLLALILPLIIWLCPRIQYHLNEPVFLDILSATPPAVRMIKPKYRETVLYFHPLRDNLLLGKNYEKLEYDTALELLMKGSPPVRMPLAELSVHKNINNRSNIKK